MLAAANVASQLLPWVAILTAVAVAWRISRGGGGSAVQELSKANEVLEKRKEELGAQVRDLLVENTALKTRTDFQEQLRPILSTMSLHEERAAERHTKTLMVLDLIARRLGEDGNGQ